MLGPAIASPSNDASNPSEKASPASSSAPRPRLDLADPDAAFNLQLATRAGQTTAALGEVR
jgi:hypothetical protein